MLTVASSILYMPVHHVSANPFLNLPRQHGGSRDGAKGLQSRLLSGGRWKLSAKPRKTYPEETRTWFAAREAI
jgi:hypothetical protein